MEYTLDTNRRSTLADIDPLLKLRSDKKLRLFYLDLEDFVYLQGVTIDFRNKRVTRATGFNTPTITIGLRELARRIGWPRSTLNRYLAKLAGMRLLTLSPEPVGIRITLGFYGIKRQSQSQTGPLLDHFEQKSGPPAAAPKPVEKPKVDPVAKNLSGPLPDTFWTGSSKDKSFKEYPLPLRTYLSGLPDGGVDCEKTMINNLLKKYGTERVEFVVTDVLAHGVGPKGERVMRIGAYLNVCFDIAEQAALHRQAEAMRRAAEATRQRELELEKLVTNFAYPDTVPNAIARVQAKYWELFPEGRPELLRAVYEKNAAKFEGLHEKSQLVKTAVLVFWFQEYMG